MSADAGQSKAATIKRERDRPASIEIAGHRLSLARSLKVLGFGVLLIAPFVVGTYYMGLLAQALIMAIFAIGVDLIWGYSGVMTFGHAAFFGLGAYLVGILLKTGVFGPATGYVGLVLAPILAGVLGLIIAWLLFTEGIEPMNFTMVTLAIAISAEQLAISWRSVTGGYDGLIGIPELQVGVPRLWMVPLEDIPLYYAILGALVLAYLFAVKTVNSPFGKVLIAIRENQTRAQALGYDVRTYKTLVFGLGSALAGFAGAIHAPFAGYVSPGLLGFILSANVVLWILVGGKGTVIGAVIGTVFLRTFENVLSSFFQFSWSLILGVVFVVIVLAFPEGIVGVANRISRRRFGGGNEP